MSDITNTAYRLGVYNYLVSYENFISHFYVDAGMYEGQV